jgi:hypothetical protein
VYAGIPASLLEIFMPALRVAPKAASSLQLQLTPVGHAPAIEGDATSKITHNAKTTKKPFQIPLAVIYYPPFSTILPVCEITKHKEI